VLQGHVHDRYKAALERVADARDDNTFGISQIMPRDLVMRKPINRKSKLHPKWDGPFVVLESTAARVYQLATANGYTIWNLVNQIRLRNLNSEERQRYTDDFWEASKLLKLHD
jgi:hypothetical protein